MQEAIEMNEILRRAGAAGMLSMGDEDDDEGDLYDPQ